MEKIISCILVTGALCYYAYKSRTTRIPPPPGPKGHWLFGNALEIAGAGAFWVKLGEYADVHGPLISVRILHQYAYVLSDPHTATELFEKRSVNYSDRDENEMSKLIGFDQDIVMLQYGPKFKQCRTMLNRALNNRAAQDYIPLQEHEVQKLMKRLMEQPEGFLDHVRLFSASIAARVAYGYTIPSFDDPFVQTAEKWGDAFSDLKHLPDWLQVPFQRRVVEIRKVLYDLREKPFRYVLEQMATGTAEDSFVSKLLQGEDGASMDEQTKEDVKRIAASFYSAGADTTISAVQSFFLAMTLYPQTQAKAQAELAAYLNSDSRRVILPKDRENLPYTSAIVKEVLRWHPIVPVVQHRSSQDDDENVVCGDKVYRIPAKSTIMVNVWKMMQNPDVYPDPEMFMPERFLVDNPPPGPEEYVFGFGRRATQNMPGDTHRTAVNVDGHQVPAIPLPALCSHWHLKEACTAMEINVYNITLRVAWEAPNPSIFAPRPKFLLIIVEDVPSVRQIIMVRGGMTERPS
ncbi:cytochrome P450 family protein [Ceratobasidium sp. AG-Ba]|nr:cytochrome P450 family protein [Ceratobasidium sp. AG-Ba]